MASVRTASNKALALAKFLSGIARRLGVAEHVYVVGGAVRNFVLKQPIKDLDVVIDSLALKGKDSEWFAQQVRRSIPAESSLKTNNYGVAILTVTGQWELEGNSMAGEVIEIANARKESYGGSEGKGYKPHLVEPATIEEDVQRREFTWNTLLWRLIDLANGPDKAQIIDLTGCGLRDLAEGVMRCPRDPDIVFSDDPSRLIRVTKFTLKYGFKIPPDVLASIKKNAQKLRNVPPGHLSNMLIETFFEPGIGKKALLEMDRLGLLEVIRDIARDDKAFAAALGHWADSKASVEFVFDLMDLGMPSGKRLGFLEPDQKNRVREITVQMSADESDRFVQILEQPGKVIDMAGLISEMRLKGAGIRPLLLKARALLLENPKLASNPKIWESMIRSHMAKTAGGEGTGDSTSVGFFIRVPESLGEQFPELKEDTSPAHVTFLIVGNVKGREEELLEIAQRVIPGYTGVSVAEFDQLDYFRNPEKLRTVPHMTVRFERPVHELRWKLVDALMEAGFEIEDVSPYVYRPHTTLGYLDGLGAKFEGVVPHGAWEVPEIEIWGLPKLHKISLEGSLQESIQPYKDEIAQMVARVATRVLQDEDCRRDYADDKRCPIDSALLEQALERKIGEVAGRDVWEVDGEIIRDSADVDFTNGGNPARYGYVPMDQLWVDHVEHPKDMACTLLHEAVECHLMEHHGFSYENGHERASDAESVMREMASNDMSASEICPMAQTWFERWQRIALPKIRVAAKYKDKKKIKTQDGDEATVYEYSERQISNRNKEKAERVEKLRKSIGDLRAQVQKDLKSDDEHTKAVALAIGLTDLTYERIGNEESADDGHFGVTGWRKKHLTFGKGRVTIRYVGKSGVKHEKVVDNAASIKALKEAVEGKGDEDEVVDCTAEDVNEYLEPFDITAKDMRGFHANSEMQTRLKAIRGKGGKLPEDKKEREKKLKDEFKKALEETAAAVGHEAATLKSQYLVPGLEEEFLKDGTVTEKLTKKTASTQPSRLVELYKRRGETVTQVFQLLQPEHYRLTCPICGGVTQCRCTKRCHEGVEVLEMNALCPICAGGKTGFENLLDFVDERNAKVATKTHHEIEEEEVERLVRPEPKNKPPRDDLRRERVKVEHDPDVDHGDRGDDDDLSLNYKKIATRWLLSDTKPSSARVAFWHLAADAEHKPGDVWESEKGWVGKNPDGNTHTFDNKEKAQAFAKGKGDGGGDKGPTDHPDGWRDTADEPDFSNDESWATEHTARTPAGSLVLGTPHAGHGDEQDAFIQGTVIKDAVKAAQEAVKKGLPVTFLAEGSVYDGDNLEGEPGNEQQAVAQALNKALGDKVQQSSWDTDETILDDPEGPIWKELAKVAGSDDKARLAMSVFLLGQGDDADYLKETGVLTPHGIAQIKKQFGIDASKPFGDAEKEKLYDAAFPGDKGLPPTEISKVGDALNSIRQNNMLKIIRDIEAKGGVAIVTPGASHAWNIKPVLEESKKPGGKKKKEKGEKPKKEKGKKKDDEKEDDSIDLSGIKVDLAKADIPDEDKQELADALSNLDKAFTDEDLDLAESSLKKAQGDLETLLEVADLKNPDVEAVVDKVIASLDKAKKVVTKKKKQKKTEDAAKAKEEKQKEEWGKTVDGQMESQGIPDLKSETLGKDSYQILVGATTEKRKALVTSLKAELDKLDDNAFESDSKDDPAAAKMTPEEKEVRKEQLMEVYRGACLAQVVAGEKPELPYDQELSPQVSMLAQKLNEMGGDPTVLLGSMEDFCGPEGRGAIRDAMGQMTTNELSEFAGDKSPYNPIFEALAQTDFPIEEESMSYVRGMLERLMLNDMTYAHDAIKRALGAGTFSMKNDKGKSKGKSKDKGKGKKDPAKDKKDQATVKKTLDAALKKVGPKAQAFVEALRRGTNKKDLEKAGAELELAQMEAVESALAEFPDNDNQALKLLREMLNKRDPGRGDKFKTKPPLASNSKERFNL